MLTQENQNNINDLQRLREAFAFEGQQNEELRRKINEYEKFLQTSQVKTKFLKDSKFYLGKLRIKKVFRTRGNFKRIKENYLPKRTGNQ